MERTEKAREIFRNIEIDLTPFALLDRKKESKVQQMNKIEGKIM